MRNPTLRERIQEQETRLSYLESEIDQVIDTLNSLRLQQEYFAFDRSGVELFEDDSVEILTGTSASVAAGTLATIVKCTNTNGQHCWCFVRVWSGPKAGQIFKRKAKNLRKLFEMENEE